MTTAQVVETSAIVNNNSPIQDYVHPDHQAQPTFEMTPRCKPSQKFLSLYESLAVNFHKVVFWTSQEFFGCQEA